MTKHLQSKFSIKHVIVEPIIIIILVCFLCSIITFASFSMTEDGTPLYKTPIWIILLFLALLFWTIRYYLNTFKHYTFLDKGFEVSNLFEKEFHSWNSVKEVSIIENSFEKILWQYLQEDTLSIYLNNGEILGLHSKYYQNLPEIRSYFKSKNIPNTINSYSKNSNIPFTPFTKRTYKGIYMFSFNGILSIFLSLLACFMLWYSWSSMALLGFFVLFGITSLSILIFGFQSYYFELNQKDLIVKNHIFLNVKHRIDLQQVRVIYFEQKFKKEPSIRIINSDYKMMSFQGSTLKNKQWKSLIRSLKNQGINIVDELFYGYNG